MNYTLYKETVDIRTVLVFDLFFGFIKAIFIGIKILAPTIVIYKWVVIKIK